MTEINWGYNCLTSGIHHGRPDAIWNLPLLQAGWMFGIDVVKQFVVARIDVDAMQFVTHGPERCTKEWAQKVSALAEEKYDELVKAKFAELDEFYASAPWKADVRMVVEGVRADKLNPNYKPLHSHDSLNMLCRILGQTCAMQVEREG